MPRLLCLTADFSHFRVSSFTIDKALHPPHANRGNATRLTLLSNLLRDKRLLDITITFLVSVGSQLWNPGYVLRINTIQTNSWDVYLDMVDRLHKDLHRL